MALSSEAILTLSEAKTFLDLESTAKDELLEILIEGITQAFNNYTGRTLKETKHTAKQYDYNGSGLFLLPNYPVKEITSLKLEDTELDPEADYFFIPDTGEIRLPAVAGVLTITYTAGYSEIPADLKLAALQQLGYEYQQAIQKAWAVTSRSQAGASTTYKDQGLLTQVKNKLDNYRRIA